MKDKSCISINLPSLEELIKREPRVCLNIRMGNDSAPPFSQKAIECAKGYADEKGIYVHLWKRNPRKPIVIYVGQTGQSFRKRLNWEFSLQHNPVSQKFRDGIRPHIGKSDVFTVFFNESDLAKMVSGCKPSNKSLRLLVEQAMIAAYESEELLNEYDEKND